MIEKHFHIDQSNAEDIAQRTFLIAFENINTLKDKSKLVTWILKIAKNEAYDFKKRASKISYVDDMQQLENDFGDSGDEDKSITRKMEVEVIADLLNKLPDTTDNEIFKDFYLKGLKGYKIAEKYKIGLNVVHKKLSRLRDKFKSKFLEKIINLNKLER